MTNFIIDAEISADKKLTNYELPADVPVGPVRIVIEPEYIEQNEAEELTREQVRERLRAAGLLVESNFAPPEAVRLDEAESLRLADLFGGGLKRADEIIDEDRGPR